jgi:hypothetical protein
MGLDFIVIDKGDFFAFRNYLNKELERWSQARRSVVIPTQTETKNFTYHFFTGVSAFVLP